MIVYYKSLLRGIAHHYQQNLEALYKTLSPEFKEVLMRGSGETEISFNFWRAGKMSKIQRPFEGVIPNLERLYQESESEFTRNRLKGFMSPQFCDACGGQRLKPEILAVTIGGADVDPKWRVPGSKLDNIPGLSIMETCALSVASADDFFATLKLT